MPKNLAKPRKAVSGSLTKSSKKKSFTCSGRRCSSLAHATMPGIQHASRGAKAPCRSWL